MIFRLVCSRCQQYRYARRAEAGATVRDGGSGPPAPRGTPRRREAHARAPAIEMVALDAEAASGGGGGGGGAGEASAETARQALLLASQALGTNAERVREAREERDAALRELRWVRDRMLMAGIMPDADIGADTGHARPKGWTALHLATMRGHADCVQLLLEAGADKEKADERDYTPLHFAAMQDRPDCLRLLLEAGANTAARTQDGRTAQDVADLHGHEHALELLRQHDAPGAHP